MYSSKLFIQLQRYFAVVVLATMLFTVMPTAAVAQTAPTDDTATETTDTGETGDTSTNDSGGETAGGDSTATDGSDGTDGSGATTGTDESAIDNGGTDGAAGTEGEAGPDGGADAGNTTDTGTETNTDSGSDTVSESTGGEETATTDETGDGATAGGATEGSDSGTTEGATGGNETGTDTGEAGTTNETDGGSTDAGGDGGDTTTPEDGTAGTDAETGATDGVAGTTNDTGTDGTEGPDGSVGQDGTSVEDELPENPDPVTIISDNQIADDATPDDGEEVTGSRSVTGHRSRVTIDTGEATAQAELKNDVNSGDIKSYVEPSAIGGDFDNYYFNATGTNEANVTNTGSVLALTGNNEALTTGGPAEISTGDAYAALNIANVVNSTVVNSDGFLYLGNRMLEPAQSLDLTDFFFPDPDGELARANDCDLISCMSEDIYYNFSQTNTATVTNNAVIEAVTGENYIDTVSSFSNIYSGNAFGGANVVNVVNTNIVDSNYRFLTLNAMGNLDGDILLPTQEMFNAFYGRPNGMTQLEDAEDAHLVIDNINKALIDNNLDANAETGLNTANASVEPAIATGDASAKSNILDKVNQNIFGGDVMYLLIRVHGAWNGEVRGLPDGLAWTYTPEGVLIYNEGAEIVESPYLPYDVDTYNAEVTDYNEVEINNNITIDSITGDNGADGGISTIVTGNAVASANVMNIANTNVIGANWTFAVINIFGNFAGDIAFTATDLTLTGSIEAADLLAPNDVLTYHYTVHNNSTLPATDVVLVQTLENATAEGGGLTQEVELGDIAPGESASAEFTATVDGTIPAGTTTEVNAIAVVTSYEAEQTPADNGLLISRDAYVGPVPPSCTITADKASVPLNDYVELSWSASNAKVADFSTGQVYNLSGVGTATGTLSVKQTGGDTNYVLTVTSNHGNDTCSVFVETEYSGGNGAGTGVITASTTASTTDDGTGGAEEISTGDTGSTQSSGGGGGSSSGGGGGGSSSKTKSIAREEVKEIDPDSAPHIVLQKTAVGIEEGDIVKAGESVDYLITITNRGGNAYDAVLHDTLTNPIGSVLNEDTWELGTILAGEEIDVEYTTTYNLGTPSGVYTNTARIEVYRHEDSKANGDDPLRLGSKDHEIVITGVPLAVGNVEPVAYFPAGNGTVGALVVWETSKPAKSQIFYSPKILVSPFNRFLPKYGYQNASFKFDVEKTKHAMILYGLKPGTEYAYRIHAYTDKYNAFGGDYSLKVPAVVARLMVPAIPRTMTMVAGASTVQPVNTYQPAATTYTPAPPAAPVVTTEPEPVAPEPSADQASTSNSGGLLSGVKDKVFGFFR